MTSASIESAARGGGDHWQEAYNRGVSYYAAGQLALAIDSYCLAARLNPFDADIFFNLALAYKNAGDSDKAVVAYVAALAIDPDDYDVHYNLGRLYNEMGHRNQAITALENALAIRSDFAPALTNLGAIYAGHGMCDKAVAVYERLLVIGYKPMAANHIIHALKGQTTDAAPFSYVKELFDDCAGHFEERLVGDLFYDIPRQLVDFLRAHDGDRKTYGRMLDLGCGTGLCGQAFARMAESITGVDLSVAMIAKAREKEVYKEIVEGDIVSSLDGAPVYDLIVAGDVFIYLGELESVFSNLPDCLAKDGRIVFSTEFLAGRGYRLQPSGRYAHSTSYITILAAENGLEVRAVKSVNIRQEYGRWIAGELFIVGYGL